MTLQLIPFESPYIYEEYLVFFLISVQYCQCQLLVFSHNNHTQITSAGPPSRYSSSPRPSLCRDQSEELVVLQWMRGGGQIVLNDRGTGFLAYI
jgi:hypothetical protein